MDDSDLNSAGDRSASMEADAVTSDLPGEYEETGDEELEDIDDAVSRAVGVIVEQNVEEARALFLCEDASLRLDPNGTDDDGTGFLAIASFYNSEDIIDILLEAGADLNARNNTHGWTALHAAASKGHLGIVRRLLDAGADPIPVDSYGKPPASYARDNLHEDVVNELEAWAAGGGITGERTRTQLAKAAQSASSSSAGRAVADPMADAVARLAGHLSLPSEGNDPASGADDADPAAAGAGAALNTDAEADAEVEAVPSADLEFVLDCAAGRVEAVQEALESGAVPGPDVQDDVGNSALHAAAFDDQIEVVELLLRAGANKEHRNKEHGWTPLHAAAAKGNVGSAAVLLAAGADAGAVDVYGNPPEHYASANGHADMVHLLQHADAAEAVSAAVSAGKAVAAATRAAAADADEAAEAAEMVIRAAAAADEARIEALPAVTAAGITDGGSAEQAGAPTGASTSSTGLRHRAAAASSAASSTDQYVSEPPLPTLLSSGGGGSSRVVDNNKVGSPSSTMAAATAKRPGFKLMTVHIVLLVLIVGVGVPLAAFLALRRAAPEGR